MPELKWNENEVIECLGVLPEKEDFFESHNFKIQKDGLILEMTIWQYESLVALSIFKENNDKPFLTLYFIVRNEIKFINEKDFASLQFCDVVVVPIRFWMYESPDLFDKKNCATKLNIELTVYPQLEFKVE
jgi:hypothetical protein